ncbi:hypothetical protein E4T56_gene14714, partial [Termitomyces sp. T112]
MAAPFLAVWYVAGVAIPAVLGALLGPPLLRWRGRWRASAPPPRRAPAGLTGPPAARADSGRPPAPQSRSSPPTALRPARRLGAAAAGRQTLPVPADRAHRIRRPAAP